MSAVILQIADACVAALNGASLTPSFTAERFYVPVYDLQRDLSALKVSVVPSMQSLTSTTRKAEDFTFHIDIAVQKRIGNDALTPAQINTACDPLMLLSEAIIDLFRSATSFSVAGAQCMDIENPVVYAPDHLDEQRVFTSVIRLIFKMVRPQT